MDEAKQELHRIINDREMKDSLLLVFANKQDLDTGKLPPSLFPLSFPFTPVSFPHCLPLPLLELP